MLNDDKLWQAQKVLFLGKELGKVNSKNIKKYLYYTKIYTHGSTKDLSATRNPLNNLLGGKNIRIGG
jgi:hypothetical protein